MIIIHKMSSANNEEEVEVRSLLNRHRRRILIDLENSDMLSVLVKRNVISVITEALLVNFQSLPEDQRRKCDLLIDTIAKCGFKKFKEFCYAIEEECPELIHEMINDHVPATTDKISKESLNGKKYYFWGSLGINVLLVLVHVHRQYCKLPP